MKYALIRAVQSARTIQGQKRSTWVRRFYALLTPVYDFTFLKLPGYRQAAQDLIMRLEVDVSDAALDAGCGTGLLTLPLAKQARQTIGLDLSPAMLQKLADKAAGQGITLELHEGSVLDLPFDDGEFTLVTTAFMLLYLTPEEKQRAMSEICRVLTPDGRLGCLSSQGEIADIFLTRQAWQTLLSDAGFTNVHIEDCYDVFRRVTTQKEEMT
ncbi:MAG: class I SAM-dependent methyltransferase [Anaerolineae bacterium]